MICWLFLLYYVPIDGMMKVSSCPGFWIYVSKVHTCTPPHSSGGWDKDDHEEFVRIVRSCGGDYVRAVAVCMERVVGFTKSEVMDHARWHMDYMDLLVRWVFKCGKDFETD